MKSFRSAGRLISILHRQGRKFIDRGMRPLGLGAGQFPILAQLYHQDGITQDVIAKKIGVDRTTLARTIVKLEEKGFIERTVDPDDHRAYQVRLTEKGRSAREGIFQVLESWTDSIFGDMSKEERRQFYNLLNKAVRNVRDTTFEEVSRSEIKPS